MRSHCKKMLPIRLDRLDHLERRLERYAAKGQVLERCSPFAWTFRKGAPQTLHYAIAHYPAGSLFRAEPDEQQQSYLDLAQAAGWRLVAQNNQLHIFCNAQEDPVPFETDEKEKLRSIEKSMNRSFVPSLLAMLAVFSLNLGLQVQSLLRDPIDFLSDPLRLLSCAMFLLLVLYEVYALAQYFFWLFRAKKRLALGGGLGSSSPLLRGIDLGFTALILALLLLFLWQMAQSLSLLALFLVLVQLPLLLLVFWGSIRLMKKRKASALQNKIISVALLILCNLCYLLLIFLLVIQFGLGKDESTRYETIHWPLASEESFSYRLYQDEIPLRSQDLYGAIPFSYYSYEANSKQTIFLQKQRYTQAAPPDQSAPPEISYTILRPRFSFVYRLVQEELLTPPAWREETRFVPLDNALFGTSLAYQEFYEGQALPHYLLFFAERIVQLELEEPLAAAQIPILIEKLGL